MMFVDRHERSLAPKLFVAMALLAGLVLAGWMLFGPLDALPEGWRPPHRLGDPARRLILMICFCTTLLRLLATLFVFYRRKMFWVEAILIANIMPLVFPLGAYFCAGSPSQSDGRRRPGSWHSGSAPTSTQAANTRATSGSSIRAIPASFTPVGFSGASGM